MSRLPSAANAAYALEEVRGARFLSAASGDAQDFVKAVRSGLPFEVFEKLRSFLEVPALRLGAALRISERTLARRKGRGRLTPEESDRLLRLARIAEMALVVFEENVEGARRWMTRPKALLDGESPLERSDTETGSREITDMLYAVEFTAAA